MKTREVFHKDPLSWNLINDGVSNNNTEDLRTLRYELESFVCEGEYAHGMARILQAYVDNFGKPEQRAAWISGFYGSGKSHLAKVLRYLWIDKALLDGSTPRALTTLPRDVRELLKEVTTLGRRHGGLHMAGGTLKAGAGHVRLRVMSLFFKSVGLPEQYPYAKFLMDLAREGKLDAFRVALEKQGKNFDAEVRHLYTSTALANAYVEVSDHLTDPGQVGALLKAQYPNVQEVSIDEMRVAIREAISNGDELPCTLLVLDEVQQFVGQSIQDALDIQEVTETLSKQMDGRVMVVATGQSALNATPNLQRLTDRFSIKVHLRDNDVDKVVRTVVLQKSEANRPQLTQMLAKYEGEIKRQLKTTKLATQSEDDDVYVADYPLLPVRKRFWERVLHAVDASGSAAQMRTQLRVVHEACRKYADKDLGAVVPGDFLYDQIAGDLVGSGEMQKRFQEMIDEQRKKQPDGDLRARICALVFLISKLPREQGTDSGVRPEPEHLADLLSEDLVIGSTQLRQVLPGLLQSLEQEGVLMRIDNEYRLQTTEGAAWESEYKKRLAAALNGQPQIAAEISSRLQKAVGEALGGTGIAHGDAKERRKIVPQFGESRPMVDEAIVLWVRDGFSVTETSFLAEVRKLSTDDATLHLYLPKVGADELRTAVASWQAASETLNYKGSPTSAEGQQSKQAFVTRRVTAEQKVIDLVDSLLRGARLYLSGGQEQPMIDLRTGVESAAKQVLNRLYPKFNDGDSANWETARRRAKEGAANALESVGFRGEPKDHPVAMAILQYLGAGKTGAEVRKRFRATPFGWPQDAIDGTLTTLVASTHLKAEIDGKPISLADLDQKKLGLAVFRAESPVLTTGQKFGIRKLFKDAGLDKLQPEQDANNARLFVDFATTLAAKAGGDAPLPLAPLAPELKDLQGRSGNDLLLALYDQRESLLAKVQAWKKVAAEIEKRKPAFELVEQLAARGGELTEAWGWLANLNAIKQNRSLLEDPDPVTPIRQAIASALRARLQQAQQDFNSTYSERLAALQAQPVWQGLSEAKQIELLSQVGIKAASAPAVGTDEQLRKALEECPLSTWQSRTDALPFLFERARLLAVKEAEPKAKAVKLASGMIRNDAELTAWLDSARATIEEALKDGPVIL